jgi:hypothetical protein
MSKWQHYMETRTADYGFRCRTRYKAALDRLFTMGLNNSHTVVDVGAGTCQFGRYLRETGNFQGEYMPIDAVIDGTDLNTWVPLRQYDFFVCLEVVEHLYCPTDLIGHLLKAARRGVVLTTPNSEAVDVLACDPTHVSIVRPITLFHMGFSVKSHTWFGVENDSILAWSATR